MGKSRWFRDTNFIVHALHILGEAIITLERFIVKHFVNRKGGL